MAYTKHNFAAGQIVTAAQLNEAETQIALNETKIDAKQDKLIAGTNITIGSDGKTISAVNTAESITTALGYTPAKASDVNENKANISQQDRRLNLLEEALVEIADMMGE